MGEEAAKYKLGLIVGVPFEKLKTWDTARPVCPEWALTLCHLVYPTGLNHTLMAVAGKRIDEARNEIVEKAVEWGVPAVFFLDDDVIVPATTLLHLYPLLMADEDIIAVGGIYPPKREPTEPMAYRSLSQGPAYDMKWGEIFDVEGLATGCMLVKTALFKNIPKPWFKTVKDAGQDENGMIYTRAMSDDLYFCKKAKEAGFRIIAHAGILCGHADAVNHRIYNLDQYRPKKSAASPSSSES